ncbi:MAG TPA: SDR family oxidoreductase [Dehalococcoidales bacterium]|nr:SDR family oxidoreductase [Dehalococcoidales bacterium]
MIVVTGATGHIGNVLVRLLLTLNQKVRALVLPGEDLTALRELDVEIVTGDICRPESLMPAFKGADMVYHLAGIISIIPGRERILQEVNVQGTRNVIDACLKNNVRRLVYTSSIHALKEPPHGTAISESQPFDPSSVLGHYAKSKAQASLEALSAAARGLDTVIVCPSGVIGPYDFKGSEMGYLIQAFVRRKLPAGVNGAYDFIDVRDVAAGMVAAGEKGISGEVYILSGEQITIRQLFKSLELISGIKPPRLMVPCWLAKAAGVIITPFLLRLKKKPLLTPYSIDVLQSNSQIDSKKTRKALGFSARPLIESLRDTVLWFKLKTQPMSNSS